MEFGILGPVEARVDGQPLDLGPKKQRSLFALLLIHRNKTVSTDRILDALWGDDADGKEKALWVYISRLRSVLGNARADDLIVTKDHGYSLQTGSDPVDVDMFEERYAEGRALVDSDPRGAADLLEAALVVWRGAPLEDFAYEEWAQDEILRLSGLRAACVDLRFDAEIAAGAAGELISQLEVHCQERPYDETPVRQLMVALYRSGRQTESLRTYERFRRRLAEDTGMDPSPELRRLQEQVLVHDQRLGTTRTTSGSTARNPYRGLEAFREEDAALFFGRDRLTADLLVQIANNSIVTVIGPSGSGKSSVVRSGAIPALRKGAVEGSDSWLIATMLPGGHPFVELEAALLRTRIDAPESLRPQLDGRPDEILRAARRMAIDESTTVLVVVDQFEELFTTTSPDVTDRFLTAIVEASKDARSRIRFLFTLRADFYDRPLQHAAFASAFAGGIVNVTPMAPEELEAAASGPARAVGVRLESGLEAALIGDVLGEPGALPLFQFALTDLFDRRVGETLTLETYRGMGGVHGSLSRKAEYLYASLTPGQQLAAKQVFLRLVTVTEGAANSRRRVEAAELLSLDLDVVDLQEVLTVFGSDRLLSFDRSEVTGSPTVEVAHEALLSRWERLAEWITDAREDLKRNSRLATLAAEWTDNDQDPAFLLGPGRLADYEQWSEGSAVALGSTEVEFLDASRAVAVEQEEVEAARLAREAAASRRARRSVWGLVVSAVIAVSVIIGVLWVATRPPGPSVAFVYPANEIGGAFHTTLTIGFESAARNTDVNYIDAPITQAPQEVMQDVLDNGAELVFVLTSTIPLLFEFVNDYPDVTFVVVDYPREDLGPVVHTLRFAETDGSYLMGVAAAATTRTGSVGFIGGWQDSYMERWAAAFEHGAKSTDPNVDVLIGWVDETGSWGYDDPPGAARVANSMFEEGVDVVFTAAGGSGLGTIEAARSYSRLTERPTWAIGVDVDEGYLSSEALSQYVLTSMLKRLDLGVEAVIADWLDGSLEQHTAIELVDGGIAYTTDNAAFSAAIPAVRAAEQALMDGEIEPEEITVTPSMWTTSSGGTIEAAFDGSSCTAFGEPLQQDQAVSVVLHNNTSENRFFGVGSVAAAVDQTQLQALMDEYPLLEAIEIAEGDTRNSWVLPPGGIYELRTSSSVDPSGGLVVVCDVFSGRPVASNIIPVVNTQSSG